MTMLSFRVDDAEAADVQRWAGRLGVERSQVLREALHRHLVWLRSVDDIRAWHEHPPSEAEAALDAIEAWSPAEDWSDWNGDTG